MCLTVIVCILAGSQYSLITKMFNGDAGQQKKLNHCMIVIYVIIILQSSYGILVGIAKGLGLQYMTSLITTLSYFGIALTLAEFMGSSFVSFFRLEETKLFTHLHGALGYNIGFMIGLLVLNIGLFYMLYTVSWEKICRDITAYHDLVNEMSFRKQIYHMQISRSHYNPTLPASQSNIPQDHLNLQGVIPAIQNSEQPPPGRPSQDIIHQIEGHHFMRSSCQDFNSEQQQIMNRYVQEKDDEFERLLKDEDDLSAQRLSNNIF